MCLLQLWWWTTSTTWSRPYQPPARTPGRPSLCLWEPHQWSADAETSPTCSWASSGPIPTFSSEKVRQTVVFLKSHNYKFWRRKGDCWSYRYRQGIRTWNSPRKTAATVGLFWTPWKNRSQELEGGTIVLHSSSGSLGVDPRVGETVSPEVFSCKVSEQSAS